jgi:hypothetical protein
VTRAFRRFQDRLIATKADAQLPVQAKKSSCASYTFHTSRCKRRDRTKTVAETQAAVRVSMDTALEVLLRWSIRTVANTTMCRAVELAETEQPSSTMLTLESFQKRRCVAGRTSDRA